MLILAFFRSRSTDSCQILQPFYVLLSYLFIPYLRCDGEIQPLLSQGWTLNYEFFFYICFALTLHFNKITGLLILCTALFALSLTKNIFWQEHLTYIGLFYTDNLLLYFVIWILFAIARDYLYNKIYVTVSTSAFFFSVLLIWLIIDACAPYRADILADHALMWVVAPTSAALFIFIQPLESGRSAQTFELLGDASYSIYLMHIFWLNLAGKIAVALHFNTDSYLFLIFSVTTAIAGGLLVYISLEQPLQKWVKLWKQLKLTR